MTHKKEHVQVDSFSYGVVLWEIITKERSQRGNWRPVRVPEECPAEVDALLRVRRRPVSFTETLILTHTHGVLKVVASVYIAC